MNAVYEPTVMEVLMKQQGLSQARLGRMIGKDQAVLSNMMNNIKPMDIETRRAIANAIKLADPELLLTPYNPENRERYTRSN